MNPIPRISESEWLVMNVLWEKNPLTANTLVDLLSDTIHWKPKTIKTLLNRLVKKGILGFETSGREYHYYPLVNRSDCIKQESRTFLNRVFGGTAKPMIAMLVEDEDLSPQDIEELKRMLDEKKQE